MSDLYIGLMSGTSMDGVDGVIADFSAHAPRVVGASNLPMPDDLKAELLALNHPGDNELHRAAVAAQHLCRLYASVVRDLLQVNRLSAREIRAIGAHGQTLRHCPNPPAGGPCGYTLQINQPALLAEWTGIAVVADFRSRDIAAGGQGAPLVPAFHQAVFARPGQHVGVLNIGGIANVSLLDAMGEVRGFDTGPGNVLLDHWCQRHTGAPFDRQGAWGAGGRVVDTLLHEMLQEPYFLLRGVKSTGRDLFHAQWLERHLARHEGIRPQDVQATLARLTVQSIADALHGVALDCLLVCGGGARNLALMHDLQAALPGVPCTGTDALGWPVDQVEATAFAWLARQTLHGQPGNLAPVTGACGPRVLGAIYPA